MLGPLHFLLTISVLTSATAATQTTILPAARQALSMGRRGAIPRRFAEIHPKNLVPARATIWAGVLSVIWFIAISILSSDVLADCVAGLGFLVCIYYGFTGFACTIFYRYEIFKSVRNFVSLALMPTLGGLALMGVLGYGVTSTASAANDSSPPLLGLGVPDWIAILGVGGGDRAGARSAAFQAPAFFREPRQKYGDKIETVTPEAEFAPADSML